MTKYPVFVTCEVCGKPNADLKVVGVDENLIPGDKLYSYLCNSEDCKIKARDHQQDLRKIANDFAIKMELAG